MRPLPIPPSPSPPRPSSAAAEAPLPSSSSSSGLPPPAPAPGSDHFLSQSLRIPLTQQDRQEGYDVSLLNSRPRGTTPTTTRSGSRSAGTPKHSRSNRDLQAVVGGGIGAGEESGSTSGSGEESNHAGAGTGAGAAAIGSLGLAGMEDRNTGRGGDSGHSRGLSGREREHDHIVGGVGGAGPGLALQSGGFPNTDSRALLPVDGDELDGEKARAGNGRVKPWYLRPLFLLLVALVVLALALGIGLGVGLSHRSSSNAVLSSSDSAPFSSSNRTSSLTSTQSSASPTTTSSSTSVTPLPSTATRGTVIPSSETLLYTLSPFVPSTSTSLPPGSSPMSNTTASSNANDRTTNSGPAATIATTGNLPIPAGSATVIGTSTISSLAVARHRRGVKTFSG